MARAYVHLGGGGGGGGWGANNMHPLSWGGGEKRKRSGILKCARECFKDLFCFAPPPRARAIFFRGMTTVEVLRIDEECKRGLRIGANIVVGRGVESKNSFIIYKNTDNTEQPYLACRSRHLFYSTDLSGHIMFAPLPGQVLFSVFPVKAHPPPPRFVGQITYSPPPPQSWLTYYNWGGATIGKTRYF